MYFRTPSPTSSSVPDTNCSSKADAQCQTKIDVIDVLLAENERLKEENLYLKGKLDYHSLHVETLSDMDLKILTGFNKIQLETIFSFLNFTEDADNSLSMKQKLYIFFVRLKTGLTEEILAVIFRSSQSSISRIIVMMTELIYNKVSNINIWPTKEQNKYYMPYLFQLNFPNCRIIVDSTEFEIQKPSDPKIQQLTFSNYKNRNTIKCLIGIVPSGAISLISDTWGGAVSDRFFLKSNILELLEPGDVVLADRGFTVRKELKAKGCKLYTPHFLKDKIQFNLVECKDNKKISRHRVHVERAIVRIKNFKFFSHKINILSLHSISQLIYIIAFFSNFGNPLIKC